MKKMISIAAASLVLAACNSRPVMVKDERPMTAQQRDEAECSYQADKAVAMERNVFIANDQRASLFASCMRARGYRVAGK